jgi:hypothetical protein
LVFTLFIVSPYTTSHQKTKRENKENEEVDGDEDDEGIDIEEDDE